MSVQRARASHGTPGELGYSAPAVEQSVCYRSDSVVNCSGYCVDCTGLQAEQEQDGENGEALIRVEAVFTSSGRSCTSVMCTESPSKMSFVHYFHEE